jgi:hypothetical protein
MMTHQLQKPITESAQMYKEHKKTKMCLSIIKYKIIIYNTIADAATTVNVSTTTTNSIELNLVIIKLF